MIILLILLIAVLPFLYGTAVLGLLRGRSGKTPFYLPDRYIAGVCMVIGIAAVTNLVTAVLGWSVSRMTLVTVLLLAAAAVSSLVLIWLFQRKKKASGSFASGVCDTDKATAYSEATRSGAAVRSEAKLTGLEMLLAGALALSVLLQIILIMTTDMIYAEGDLTLESIRTFQSVQTLYQINPLTGQPYSQGIPVRLKILCLPGLYTVLCEATGLDAELVVCRIIPCAVLLFGYGAYYSLGKTIFGKGRTACLVFLLAVSVLCWFGDYMMPMDGFLLLHCGYRGTAVRNGILLPFVWNMCLRKRWLPVILAVLAEACIVWTFYGLGYCLASAVIFLAMYVLKERFGKREGKICRNS